jgi:hypothetical protein
MWTFVTFNFGLSVFAAASRSVKVLNAYPGKALGLFVMLALISLIYFFMLDSPLLYIFFDVIHWNLNFDPDTVRQMVFLLVLFISFFGMHLIFPMMLTGNSLVYYSLMEISNAGELNERISKMEAAAKSGL